MNVGTINYSKVKLIKSFSGYAGDAEKTSKNADKYLQEKQKEGYTLIEAKTNASEKRFIITLLFSQEKK